MNGFNDLSSVPSIGYSKWISVLLTNVARGQGLLVILEIRYCLTILTQVRRVVILKSLGFLKLLSFLLLLSHQTVEVPAFLVHYLLVI